MGTCRQDARAPLIALLHMVLSHHSALVRHHGRLRLEGRAGPPFRTASRPGSTRSTTRWAVRHNTHQETMKMTTTRRTWRNWLPRAKLLLACGSIPPPRLPSLLTLRARGTARGQTEPLQSTARLHLRALMQELAIFTALHRLSLPSAILALGQARWKQRRCTRRARALPAGSITACTATTSSLRTTAARQRTLRPIALTTLPLLIPSPSDPPAHIPLWMQSRQQAVMHITTQLRRTAPLWRRRPQRTPISTLKRTCSRLCLGSRRRTTRLAPYSARQQGIE